MAISETSITNASLALIGAKSITSLSDNTPAARWAKMMFEMARGTCFGLPVKWKFAKTRTELTKLSTDPAFGSYDHQYQLPPKCVRIADTVDEDDDDLEYAWDREFVVIRDGGKEQEYDVMLCSEDEVYIHYIRLRTDPGVWPMWFVKLVYIELAILISGPIKQHENKDRLKQLWEIAYERALSANGMEGVVLGKYSNAARDKGNNDVIDATGITSESVDRVLVT